MRFSVILRGGNVYDGSGGDPVVADVGVDGNRIAALGDLREAAADEVLDVAGRAVAPGFIDVHTHCDFVPFLGGDDESVGLASLKQGVTTQICGNCGFSAFPALPERLAEVHGHVQAVFGVGSAAYETLVDYCEAVEERPLVTNFGFLTGHGTLRAGVVGFDARACSRHELETMRALLRDSIREGALGFSSGLIYPPGSYAPREELAALAAVAAAEGVPYTTHMRDEGDAVEAALEEALDVGRRSGAAVQISHHKVAGRRNWGRSAQTLAMIDSAADDDVDVAIDVYPYTAGSTVLRALLPPWANEGDVPAVLARLQDSYARARIAEDCEAGLPGWQNFVTMADWDGIVVANTPRHRDCEGRTILALADERGTTPAECVCDLIVGEEGGGTVIVHMMEEEDVRAILRYERAMIGSDSMPLAGKPHPRVAGTFPRVLSRYARDEAILSVAEAIFKMTAFPADRFALRDRGRVAIGSVADLVVFAPDSVRDAATYSDPLQPPLGIDYVLLNGRVAVRAGCVTGVRAGRVIAR